MTPMFRSFKGLIAGTKIIPLLSIFHLQRCFLAPLCIVAIVLSTADATAQETRESGSSVAIANEVAEPEILVRPIRTDSPQQTLTSFIVLRGDLEAELGLYFTKKSREGEGRIVATLLQMTNLIDLSEAAPSARRDIGIDTVAHLLDIFGRNVLPNMESIPDAESLEADASVTSYLIPSTPFRIVRLAEGEQAGEYLFSAKTVRTAPEFARLVGRIPLHSSIDIESWSRLLPQLTGWMIPSWLVVGMPKPFNAAFLDTPFWKVLAVFIIAFTALPLFAGWHRLLFLYSRRLESSLGQNLVMSLWPLTLIFFLMIFQSFFELQINLTGRFALFVSASLSAFRYIAATYLLWLTVRGFFEWIILSPWIPDKSLNASMLRLLARMIGAIGGVIVLAYGAQQVGLPVFSILAGLGIGGLAIALALRPTLENLIGGFILYLDKPVQVGDFCEFGVKEGIVENIGMRSTQIRGLDRTLISIPNAQFADMQLINWARCDEMQILHVIGLRYETDGDQLRHVLAGMREMLHSHPMIASDTVRVRFIGYGASSLDIEIRVYAKTREWNEFYAIREDILLRMKDIVSESGTDFSFPSVTVYAGQDKGLDTERAEAAKENVAAWRRSGRLPFPRFASSQVERVRNTLDYPPHGSVELGPETAEGASAEPLGHDDGVDDKNPT
jgi:MscS family membrane protein